LTTAEHEELRRLRREVKQLKVEREILKKSRGLVCQGERIDPATGFRFVKMNQAEFDVATQCRVLGLSRSGYYAWLKRGPSARAYRDAVLSEQIRTFHVRSKGTYGAPRIRRDLREAGERVGQKRVARLMRAAGWQGVSRRKGTVTTVRDTESAGAPDRVRRDFSATAPDQLWVADITYIPTWTGFCIWRWCWMRSAGVSWAGVWPLTCVRS